MRGAIGVCVPRLHESASLPTEVKDVVAMSELSSSIYGQKVLAGVLSTSEIDEIFVDTRDEPH
jgi:hypothetical protein